MCGTVAATFGDHAGWLSMLLMDSNWIWTLIFAAFAVTLAALGLGIDALAPGAFPLLTMSLLIGSLLCTGAAFWRLAMRVRRLELENLGLIEEISQEFDRVKDRFQVYGDAIGPPRAVGPVEGGESSSLHRVTVK